MISEGKYQALIMYQQLGETTTGKPQFVLTFQLQGKRDSWNPDAPLEDCEYAQRSIYMVLTDRTVERYLGELAQLGYSKASFGPLDPDHNQHHSFVDQEIPVYCKWDEWEGKTREKWNLDFGGQRQVKPLENSSVRELDALFGKQLKAAVSSSSPEPVSGEYQPAPAPAADDEIPF